MLVRSLGGEDFLEKEMATHTSILAWEIPCTEEPGGLQFMGSPRVRHSLATKQYIIYSINTNYIYVVLLYEITFVFHVNTREP